VLYLTWDIGTLQELIAPISVDFFSMEGARLGTKTELESKISGITGIPIAALRGAPLSGFSVEERKSWAAHRKTKRIEDSAYCLMGIFDVYMPLIYGERENALIRLEKKIKKSATVSDRFALTSTAGRSEFPIGDYSGAIEAGQNLGSTERRMADRSSSMLQSLFDSLGRRRVVLGHRHPGRRQHLTIHTPGIHLT
jgi:hypothetical protein